MTASALNSSAWTDQAPAATAIKAAVKRAFSEVLFLRKTVPGYIPERTAYREAQNRGQAVTETKHKALNERVDELMGGLYARVANQLQAKQKRQVRSARKRKHGR